MSSSHVTKQPLRVVEVPLRKFSEEVIPHHQQVFTEYKTIVQKVAIFPL